ncbi:MAG: hypothetical protein VW270_02140 [Candidatus Poseidoniales archaeon]
MSHPDPLYEIDTLQEIDFLASDVENIRLNLQKIKEEILKRVADLQFVVKEEEEQRKQASECIASIQDLLTKI